MNLIKDFFRLCYLKMGHFILAVSFIVSKVSFCCLQLTTKLENNEEELTEERRRHEETRNQLETTKRQLETAEKVLIVRHLS